MSREEGRERDGIFSVGSSRARANPLRRGKPEESRVSGDGQTDRRRLMVIEGRAMLVKRTIWMMMILGVMRLRTMVNCNLLGRDYPHGSFG